MRLRKPCEHGMYDDHAGLIYEKPYEHCPGGEFLPDVNRFEVIDHTNTGEGRAFSKWEEVNFNVAFDLQDGGRTLKVFLTDALANQVGESE